MDPIHVVQNFPRAVKEIENTWIAMPDGTRLAARIWLPEDAEEDPVPAILEYLPYRKRDGTVERDQLTHPYFAGHGYASVRVDMRGTGDSEGICLGEYLRQEQDDALAIIDWLATQTWCSGRVGMIGISWGGFNGLQVAARQPPALAAVITLCSTDDRYADDIHFMGGCALTDKIAWGATAFSIANTPPDPAIVGERWRDMWRQRLDNNGLWMLDWFSHQRRDDFYAHGSVCEDYAKIKVPVYAVGGWTDGYTNAIFRMLENLSCPRKGLIGPWAHKYPHFATPGPRIGFLQECLRWWDQHLKGHDTGIMDEPMLRAWIQEPALPATAYDQRPGRWVAEPGWHGAALDISTLYLEGQSLSYKPGASPIVVKTAQNAGWTAGAWCGYGGGDGALDQNGELGLMTLFESEPLQDDLQLLGFPVFHATLRCDAAQANLTVVLSSVNDDGSATLLSYGVLNLTHRHGHREPAALQPGEAFDIAIQLNAVGQRIAMGQRLRLALSTAYWPVIWPAQYDATLTLTAGSARIELPQRAIRAEDHTLPAFARPETAPPLKTETLSEGEHLRTREINFLSGLETYQRYSDSGAVKHLHTGLTVQHTSRETFTINPADVSSACALCEWTMVHQRDGWYTELDTTVSVQALPTLWRISASLTARDAEGVVAHREWSEDISRDLV
jgi:putative CocE/NonD family hydrolase